MPIFSSDQEREGEIFSPAYDEAFDDLDTDTLWFAEKSRARTSRDDIKSRLIGAFLFGRKIVIPAQYYFDHRPLREVMSEDNWAWHDFFWSQGILALESHLKSVQEVVA